ncbi:MAG: peptide/nickel transport system permease protein [Gaiellaceae bacterium]|nr:peptide/nickel transport system permease protein [Gaiellaceae bacterium]
MATTDSSTEFTLDTAASLAEDEGGAIEGKSPWALAGRRLRRNYVALGFLLLFVLIVVACALAGPYAHHVAHTGPNDNHLGETFTKNGKQVQIVSKGGFVNGTFLAGGIPVGPQLWHAGGRYVFGADNQGRDVAVRLLYGGLNSLKVGIGSAVICTLAALIFALLAGYFGGWVDWVISRFFDLIWAFPVLLLAIALGTALSINGFHHFGINIQSGSLWIPTLVISYVLIPYIGRPLRGQILSLREKEFIEAATAQGASPVRVMMSELMPNIASSVMVFFTLIIANNILTEAGLSFLGAGVQPPSPSWGTLIADGQSRIVTAPWLAIIPGIAIVLTVLSLNIFGDGLRDALDPRAKVRMER